LRVIRSLICITVLHQSCLFSCNCLRIDRFPSASSRPMGALPAGETRTDTPDKA
jgi:hypothetical protein